MRPKARELILRLGSQGGYIRGLILQAALAMTVLALAVNDGGQLVRAQIKAESVARAAATAGADTWFRTHKSDRTKLDAQTAASQIDPEAIVTSVEILSNGTVTVRVEKIASTLVVHRVGFLKKYATQVATDSEIGLKPS